MLTYIIPALCGERNGTPLNIPVVMERFAIVKGETGVPVLNGVKGE